MSAACWVDLNRRHGRATVHSPADQPLDWDLVSLTGEHSGQLVATNATSSSPDMLTGHVRRHLLQSESFDYELNYFLQQVSLFSGVSPLAADELGP